MSNNENNEEKFVEKSNKTVIVNHFPVYVQQTFLLRRYYGFGTKGEHTVETMHILNRGRTEFLRHHSTSVSAMMFKFLEHLNIEIYLIAETPCHDIYFCLVVMLINLYTGQENVFGPKCMGEF